MTEKEAEKERERDVVDRKGKRERGYREKERVRELHILLGLSTLIL